MLCVLHSDKKLTVAYLHRSMVGSYKELAQDLGIEVTCCISYTQLQRTLKRIDYQCFNKINESFFNQQVEKDASEWYAIDGKELRGSIDGVAGEKRGQSIVLRTSHSSKQSSTLGGIMEAKILNRVYELSEAKNQLYLAILNPTIF